ncbi:MULTISPECIES: SufD family Fe-S cluster assembly protein [Sulfurovum]|uniref:SufD family Fe-S cluster assembly protein n=1 Tax=Sulfurovum xiamenensis TaxID=3019066 RepID=A0ABT7QQJ4_9BACT|nr:MULTISPECIES: SufD family Fe-S cluster assembly protein [Sulfurovum]EIF51805.1 putative ABC transporter [Sulfurovum sp. AR]MDM5263357.1 SufD family Fe-S cluster assembly protein [Sulfurovum xiamenensis]
MKQLDEATKTTLKKVAYDEKEERSANFFAKDWDILDTHSAAEGLEILPINTALQKYEWLKELFFTLVDKDKDDYVKQVASSDVLLGYFIRVKAGVKITLPVYTCYMINTDKFTQCTHNIVITEEDSELHLINGCTANAHVTSGRHLGVTEYFVKDGATLTSTMIHSWGKEVEVYPRSAAHVGKDAKFISNYVAMTSVKKLQMNPLAVIEESGLGEFYTVIYAPENSQFDVGSTVILNGDGASSEIISRVVSNGGEVITRGEIIGKHPNGRGSMACNGLLLSEKGYIHAIPELLGEDPHLELSHEASVGMISKDELAYLMASGIEEEKAKSLIIEGFLDLKIPSLPEYLQRQINDIVKETKDFETM